LSTMTTTNNTMLCTSCKKPKAQLKQRKSKVLPGVPMFLCQDCNDNKREPRGFLVIAGRTRGFDAIQFWIKPQRYIGEPITLRELT